MVCDCAILILAMGSPFDLWRLEMSRTQTKPNVFRYKTKWSLVWPAQASECARIVRQIQKRPLIRCSRKRSHFYTFFWCLFLDELSIQSSCRLWRVTIHIRLVFFLFRQWKCHATMIAQRSEKRKAQKYWLTNGTIWNEIGENWLNQISIHFRFDRIFLTFTSLEMPSAIKISIENSNVRRLWRDRQQWTECRQKETARFGCCRCFCATSSAIFA